MSIGDGSVTGVLHGPEVDGYRIVGRLGEGGMGVVWRAVQLSTHRTVALKLMSAARAGSEKARARFQREVDLSARLEHPNIARIYDGGEKNGIFFCAMELIEGVPLDEFVRKTSLSRNELLNTVKTVCEAVQYAHQRGVIHRDLKPSNILVDRDGRPHVLDFGLAKAIEASVDETLSVSLEGEIAGTPAYMSPEQAAGKNRDVDTRSDVYTLGVIIFQLLTGHFPHDTSGSCVEVMNRIAELEPRRLRQLVPRVDRELEALLSKALAREPERRYSAAGGLASDLGRYLNHEPLEAQPPTFGYLLKKKLARHRLALAIGTAVVAALVGMAVWSYLGVTRERNAALTANVEKDRQRREAERARQEAEDQRRTANEQRINAEQQTRRAVESETRANEQRRRAEMARAEALATQGDAQGAAGQWGAAKSAYQQAWEEFEGLQRSPHRAELGLGEAYNRAPPPLLPDLDRSTWAIALTRDDRQLVTGGSHGDLRLIDVRTGCTIREYKGHSSDISALAITPDGSGILAGGSGGPERRITLHRLATGKLSNAIAGVRAPVKSLSIDRDGARALVGYSDKSIDLLDLNRFELVKSYRHHEGEVYRALFCPDGRTALSASADHTLKLFELESGRVIRTFTGHGDWVLDVVIADPQTALSAGRDSVIKMWNLQTGQELRTIRGHQAQVYSINLVPGQELALSASGDNTVRLWDNSTWETLRWFTDHMVDAQRVIVSSHGKFAVSCGFPRSALIWNLQPESDWRRLDDSHGAFFGPSFSPDGRLVIIGVENRGGASIWDVETGKKLLNFPDMYKGLFMPDGKHLLFSGMDRELVLLNLADATRRAFARQASEIAGLAVTPDGRTAVTRRWNEPTLIAWDIASGRQRHEFNGHTQPVDGFSISPDGRKLATGDKDGNLRLWDLETGKPLWTARPHLYRIPAVVFTPDGSTILTICMNKVCASSTQTGTLHRTFTDPFRGPLSNTMSLTPDGILGLWGGSDRRLTIWDFERQMLLREINLDRALRATACTRDGSRVAVCVQGDLASVWNRKRARQFREMNPVLMQIRNTLASDPGNATALGRLGEWYAFRGVHDWAIELLEQARAANEPVACLTLARSYWQAGRLAEARKEFTRALEQSRNEQEMIYLKLCIDAVSR